MTDRQEMVMASKNPTGPCRAGLDYVTARIILVLFLTMPKS